MYNIRWLFQVAMQGLSDLAPAIRQAFNDDPGDDRLALVYGERPRLNILLIALAGVVVGSLFSGFGPDFPFKDEIDWSAVVLGLTHAALIRRYLFAGNKAGPTDFPWLAASLAPAAVLLMFLSAMGRLASGAGDESQGLTSFLGDLLVAVTDALGVAAALTIAVAALCFSRNWARALWDLVVRLVVFRFTVWLTVLIMLEIGIVGPIVSALLRNIFGITIPAWLPELFDQLGYVAFMSVVYLAVIGATWMACRKSFAELLETGQVNILETVAAMAQHPEKVRKKEEKKAKKALKRQRSAAADSDAER